MREGEQSTFTHTVGGRLAGEPVQDRCVRGDRCRRRAAPRPRDCSPSLVQPSGPTATSASSRRATSSSFLVAPPVSTALPEATSRSRSTLMSSSAIAPSEPVSFDMARSPGATSAGIPLVLRRMIQTIGCPQRCVVATPRVEGSASSADVGAECSGTYSPRSGGTSPHARRNCRSPDQLAPRKWAKLVGRTFSDRGRPPRAPE